MTAPVILITNDDGIDAPGIAALERAFHAAGRYRVVTVAPDGQRSAVGHSMNMFNPVRMTRSLGDRHALDGTPADCVKVALRHLCPEVALVVSGINNGPNMGVDTYYSGTVAAAREGAINGIPGIAISMNNWLGGGDYEAAARVALHFAEWVLRHDLPAGVFLNINVPDCPGAEMQGVEATRLGKRFYNERLDMRKSPAGQTYYWLVCGDMGFHPDPGSDLDAVASGFISVSPLGLDCLDHGTLEKFRKSWEKPGLHLPGKAV